MPDNLDRQQAVGLAAAAAAAAALLYSLKRKNGKRNLPDGSKDEDLIGLVGWTSRLCAAARALETQQPDALYHDPLAEALAGSEAMAYVRRTSQGPQAQEQSEPQSKFMGTVPDAQGRGQHRLGRFHVRTKYLDNQLLRFTGPDPGPPAKATKQVVLLGAGMDTRAWRLELPPGVKWFEVDQVSVLGVKHRLLERTGSELPAAQQDGAPGASQRRQAKFPLRAASYASAAGDLADGTWAAELQKAGWDPTAPTVFLAEGLTRYLKPATIEAMFRTAAKESAPGSTFIATMSPESEVAKWRTEKNSLGGVNEHVYWGHPDDLAETRRFFEGLGWYQTGSENAWSCARDVIGPNRQLVEEDEDSAASMRSYMFWIAHNVKS